MGRTPALSRPSASSSSGCTLLTGASGGIGEAIARDFAGHGSPLVLVARSRPELDRLAALISREYGVEVHVCPADLSAAEGAAAVFAFCRERALQVACLVNCAGFSRVGPFCSATPALLRQMVAVNLDAPTQLVRLFLPAMIERGRGTIVTISSMAGVQGVAGMAAYSATKAYLINLTEALHLELEGSGVQALVVCPGFIETPFISRAGQDRSAIRLPLSSAEVVARALRRGIERGGMRSYPTLLDHLLVIVQRFVPRSVAVRLSALLAGGRPAAKH